jgi:hypothetical protein
LGHGHYTQRGRTARTGHTHRPPAGCDHIQRKGHSSWTGHPLASQPCGVGHLHPAQRPPRAVRTRRAAGPAAQLSRRHVPRTTDLAAHRSPPPARSADPEIKVRIRLRCSSPVDSPRGPAQSTGAASASYIPQSFVTRRATCHRPAEPGARGRMQRQHPRLNAVGACHASARPRQVTYPGGRDGGVDRRAGCVLSASSSSPEA